GERCEERFPLRQRRVVREGGEEERTREAVDGLGIVGEDQDAILAMSLQDLPQRLTFALAEERQGALGPPSPERVPSLGAAMRGREEPGPASRLREAQALTAEEAEVHRACRVMHLLLLVGEGYLHRLDVVGRQ